MSRHIKKNTSNNYNDIMLSELVYELTRVDLDKYKHRSRKNIIECSERRFGFFRSQMKAEEFIRKHNKNKNCFFILRTYVIEPTHEGQTNDYVWEATYDDSGNLICKNATHHFKVNYHDLDSMNEIIFKGQDHILHKKNDTCWFYDEYNNVLRKCVITETPFDKDKCRHYEGLDWFDDSYLVHRIPHNDVHDHDHPLSCYVFSDMYIISRMK